MMPTWRSASPKLRFLGLSGALLILLIGVSSLSAQGVASIAQAFQTSDDSVVSGALVSLEKGTPNTVELSTPSNLEQLIGVAGDKSLIELSNSNGGIQVVTNGNTLTLVSDINGTIKTGDKITVSPIAGVGMKATVSTLIIGTAQNNLDISKAETRTVADKQGKQQTVHIAAVPVQVDKVFYEAPQEVASFLPPALQAFANSLSGRQVSAVRVLIAATLVGLLFIIVSVLIFTAVRSSIISIGRNPLSQQAVRKSLFQVGLTVLGLLVFTTVAVYLILVT